MLTYSATFIHTERKVMNRLLLVSQDSVHNMEKVRLIKQLMYINTTCTCTFCNIPVSFQFSMYLNMHKRQKSEKVCLTNSLGNILCRAHFTFFNHIFFLHILTCFCVFLFYAWHVLIIAFAFCFVYTDC